MAIPCPKLRNGSRLVVGSAASSSDLQSATADGLAECCDLAEVRLDLLDGGQTRPWQHLASIPLLFTARRASEGGAGNLDTQARMDLLRGALEDASLIDIEVASIDEMAELIAELKQGQVPWIASFHDFEKLPDTGLLQDACGRALQAGAKVFKLAAHLPDMGSLERLIDFQTMDHGLPTATMGMGSMAAESRVLCAQAGSVLNYGYIGGTATAPGQMSAAHLKAAIHQSFD